MTVLSDHEDNQFKPDVLDTASAIEGLERSSAINRISANARPQQMPRADGSFAFPDCIECGLEIGEARLRVAVKNRMCIHCAAAAERKSK